MNEKKTFKNAALGTHYPAPGIPLVWVVNDQRLSSAEWDMEVTFTKKLKPIEVGQLVEIYDDESYYPWQGTVSWFDSRYALIDKTYGEPKVVKRENIGL